MASGLRIDREIAVSGLVDGRWRQFCAAGNLAHLAPRLRLPSPSVLRNTKRVLWAGVNLWLVG